MILPDSIFANAKTVLDVGGWFKPEPRATHVVDLMPWETRGARLTLAPLPNERFSKATWFQADFLKADLRLPFSDKSFDLVVCGHTIEDLADPKPVLAEIQRVGRRGVIECPSRLTEQTKGTRDRESIHAGHPHHHWIVESVDDRLLLYSKEDSGLENEACLLPLSFTEKIIQEEQRASIVTHSWEDVIDYHFLAGSDCEQAARNFVISMAVPLRVRMADSFLRLARRTRSRLRGLPAEDSSWWSKIVEESRPYSAVELQ